MGSYTEVKKKKYIPTLTKYLLLFATGQIPKDLAPFHNINLALAFLKPDPASEDLKPGYKPNPIPGKMKIRPIGGPTAIQRIAAKFLNALTLKHNTAYLTAQGQVAVGVLDGPTIMGEMVQLGIERMCTEVQVPWIQEE